MSEKPRKVNGVTLGRQQITGGERAEPCCSEIKGSSGSVSVNPVQLASMALAATTNRPVQRTGNASDERGVEHMQGNNNSDDLTSRERTSEITRSNRLV